MQTPIILFGAGKIGKEYLDELENRGFWVLCYSDNDQNKWGKSWNGKLVIPPEDLKKMDSFQAVPSCSRLSEIIQQLWAMGLGHSIMSMEYLRCQSISNQIELAVPDSGKEWSFVIDNVTGTWGGAEDWSHSVGLKLKKQNRKVSILEDSKQSIQEEELENIIVRNELINMKQDEENNWLTEYLYSKMPFLLINNLCNDVLAAAVVLKMKYPSHVKIISIIHNDIPALYEKHCVWDQVVDRYICVSNTIKNRYVHEYFILPDKVFAALNFAEEDYNNIASHNLDGTVPIKIGYAGRILAEQKRADMIPLMVQKLKEKKVRFQLNIAGDGSYKERLLAELKEDIAGGMVKYYGKLEKGEMTGFWAEQDVMVSFSEHEGCSLCLIEALKCGVVPVVTRVSGSDELVSEQNGVLFEMGNINGCVEAIEKLEKDRRALKEYGIACQKIYKEKCTPIVYMKFLNKMIDDVLAEAD